MPNTFLRLVLILILLPLSACARQPQETTLTVMAAASLSDAFTEIGVLFEQDHPGARVAFNFAGSQQLAQQLSQGAAADVFASANQKQMDAAVQAGRIQPGAVQVFASNRLVMIYATHNPAGVSALEDLARPGVKLVLAAGEVPAGQYTLEFLEKAEAAGTFGAGYQAAVLANVVSYEDNIRAVLTKVALGEADAGIVYASDITGAEAAQVGQIDIPAALNVIAVYPIAPLADSAQPDLAAQFVALLLAPEGQEVLAKHGFLPPTP